MFCAKMLRLQASCRTAAPLALIAIFYNVLDGAVSA